MRAFAAITMALSGAVLLAQPVEPSTLSLLAVDETKGPVELREVRWRISGGPEHVAELPEGAPRGEPIALHTGPISVGGHSLQVTLVYQGTGYGILPYHQGYTYRVEREHGLDVRPGMVTTVTVVGRDDGPVRVPFADRAQVHFRMVQRGSQ